MKCTLCNEDISPIESFCPSCSNLIIRPTQESNLNNTPETKLENQDNLAQPNIEKIIETPIISERLAEETSEALPASSENIETNQRGTGLSCLAYEKILRERQKLDTEHQNGNISKEMYELELKNVDGLLRDYYKTSLAVANQIIKCRLGLELTPYVKCSYKQRKEIKEGFVKKPQGEFNKEIDEIQKHIDAKLNIEMNNEGHTQLSLALLIIKEYYNN